MIEIGDYVKLHKWTHGLSLYKYDEIFMILDIIKDGNSGSYCNQHYAVLNKSCMYTHELHMDDNRNFEYNGIDPSMCVRLSNLVLYEKGRLNKLNKLNKIINRLNDK